MIAASVLAHIWQSTVFAVAAGLLTLVLRNNPARVRYCVWMIASLKFLLPFSLLVAAGEHLALPVTHARTEIRLPVVMERISQPFSQRAIEPIAPGLSETLLSGVLFAVWLCGFIGVLGCWGRRWRRVSATARAAQSLDYKCEIARVAATETLIEPGVFGILRPVLLLPSGIADRLTPEQLEAIVAHEVCHVRYRDNLTAAIHMVVQAAFWYHPLVWWLGARLMDERERACDEEVLRLGGEPRAYAEGILQVCRFYLESQLICVSGVTGANLKKRVAAIMRHQPAKPLGGGRKLGLAAVGIAAIAGPVLVGVLNPPRTFAQQPPESPRQTFDVASIKPSQIWKAGGEGSSWPRVNISPGTLTFRNVSVSYCLEFAYGVKSFQISGPDWLNSERYDILAKASEPVSAAQLKAMFRSLLADRFKVTVHRETKEVPVYALVVAKHGPKLEKSTDDGTSSIRVVDGSFVMPNTSMDEFADRLSGIRTMDRPVLDRTGIQGVFNITLKSAANAVLRDDGPSLSTLVQEQLGLKLEPRKGPVEILVVDHAEKVPTEN